MTKILITGGSGFIGTNLLDFYLNLGYEVLSVDSASPRNTAHLPYWQNVDLLNESHLEHVAQQFSPTHIIHLAARTDLNGKGLDDYAVNIQGLENLIKIVRSLGSLNRIIFASSKLVCKNGYQPKDEFDYCPTDAYGESKAIGEKIVRASSLQSSWVIVRPTSIWGPWFDIPYKNFFETVQKGMYFHPKGHKIKKSFGFVGNTVYQLQKLIECPDEFVRGKTLYLADYPPIEVKQWADIIQSCMEAKKVFEVPINLLKGLAMTGDALKQIGFSNPPLTSFRLNNLLTEMVYDLEPLERICGPLPYNLSEGVQATVEWMRKPKQLTINPSFPSIM